MYLIANTTEDIKINSNDDRVIDLGGNTLTGTVTNYSTNLTIKNGRINGSITNEKDINNWGLGDLSNLYLNGVTISSTSQNAIYTPNWNISINNSTITTSGANTILNNKGTITISDSNIRNTGNKIAIDNTNSGKVIMNSGTISTGDGNAVYISDSATFNMNGGTVTNKSNSYPTIYIKRTKLSDSCTLNINGGTIKNNGTSCEIHDYTEYGIGLGKLKSWQYNTINKNGGSYGTITQGHK